MYISKERKIPSFLIFHFVHIRKRREGEVRVVGVGTLSVEIVKPGIVRTVKERTNK